MSLRRRLIPTVALGLGLTLGLASVLFLVLPLPVGPRVSGLICFLSGAVLMVLVVLRRAATLRIDERVVYTRIGLRLDLPRADAVAVRVIRPTVPLRQATTYALAMRVQGRDYALPFAEHWLFGAGERRQAQGLAAALGVPFEDPVGERWAGSRWRVLRWLAAGDEWKLAAIVVVLGTLAGVLLISP